MKKIDFYNSTIYKERQSEITIRNWQKGIYDFLRKREKRQCINPECKKWFEAQLADIKKYCSPKCAAQVNNPKRGGISPLSKKEIISLYQKGFSMQEIANKVGWSLHKVSYWLDKSSISKRSPSEATYLKRNPNGDPFKIKNKLNKSEVLLKGLGLGLYWGEGNKASDHSVRLGNSDPKLIRFFREFLIKICGIKREKLRYSLLLFNDANKKDAVNFWNEQLNLVPGQIKSITSLKPRGKGTYKKKSMTGVLLIEFCNTKLKKEIDKMVETLQA